MEAKKRESPQLVVPENYEHFRYVIVPGSVVPGFRQNAFYNAAYDFYRTIWKRIMTRLTGPESFEPGAFYHQHCISNLFYKDQIIAQISGRFLYLDHLITHDLDYFENFKGAALDELRRRGANSLFTLEWNAVHPEFSRRKTGFAFVDLMLRFCMEIGRSSGVDAGTGVPRKVTGVQDVLASIGFKPYELNLVKYQCPIDIMVCFTSEITTPADARVRDFMKYLWDTRLDFTGITRERPKVGTPGVAQRWTETEGIA